MSIDLEHPLLESLFETLMGDEMPPTDDAFRRWLVGQGYWAVRKLPTGEWVGGYDYLFTYGIVIGLTRATWRTRWCYPRVDFTRDQVAGFIQQWDGEGFPPGLWLKQKPEDRQHPDRPKQPWDK